MKRPAARQAQSPQGQRHRDGGNGEGGHHEGKAQREGRQVVVLAEVLGVVKDEYPKSGQTNNEVVEKLLKLWIEQRNKARSDENFELADSTRAELDEMGIVLEDTPDGTVWRWK